MTTASRDGTGPASTSDPLPGWSVIEAHDRESAIRLVQDHPLLALGDVVQLNEPV